MYNSNNFNYEPLLVEEINRVEHAFLHNIGVVSKVNFVDEDVRFTVGYEYDDKSFYVADDKTYCDNNTTQESINAHLEHMKKEVLAMVVKYIVRKAG